jgi:hypothetical protein
VEKVDFGEEIAWGEKKHLQRKEMERRNKMKEKENE